MRVIVLGYIVRGPLGGLAWHHLQYFLGLYRLGHDVYFIEDSDDYESCFNPIHFSVTSDCAFGLRFAGDLFDAFDLGERWAYFDAHRNEWHGPCGSNALELFRSADLILNISAVNPIRDWMLQPPCRALIDTDPVFTQVKHATHAGAEQNALAHTAFFSFGERIGTHGCRVPSDGLPWQPTRQPVVLEAWPEVPGRPDGNFTTVMQWDSYPAVEYQGESFGMKSASFAPYIDLPKRTRQGLEIAIGSPSAPREMLRSKGWLLTDPMAVTRDAWTYQRYIRQSKAEFSIAKHGYVVSRSGWFSERSAVYLASGKPVVTQDTGFTEWLEAEQGVLAFDSPESALDAIKRVSQDYSEHCRAARTIAVEYFSSDRVLNDLLDRATRSASVSCVGGTP